VPLSYRSLARVERRRRIDATLERFGLNDKRDLFPAQLSGGQQQLVAVARALIAHPLLILADEPTGALHSSQGHLIMRLLGELNAEGTTVVQVTHSIEHAGYGTRTLELFDGWLAAGDADRDSAAGRETTL
jgi:ABC-type lipoprotein export system ATPase subunit